MYDCLWLCIYKDLSPLTDIIYVSGKIKTTSGELRNSPVAVQSLCEEKRKETSSKAQSDSRARWKCRRHKFHTVLLEVCRDSNPASSAHSHKYSPCTTIIDSSQSVVFEVFEDSMSGVCAQFGCDRECYTAKQSRNKERGREKGGQETDRQTLPICSSNSSDIIQLELLVHFNRHLTCPGGGRKQSRENWKINFVTSKSVWFSL